MAERFPEYLRRDTHRCGDQDIGTPMVAWIGLMATGDDQFDAL
jgi:hypothetical protein